jgi:hypothetical protein
VALLKGVQNIYVATVGIILITGLIYPYSMFEENRKITIRVNYLYHYDDDLLERWKNDFSEAMEIATNRLNQLNLFQGYEFDYIIGDSIQIESVVFGRGSATPEFDENRTMNKILSELISPEKGYKSENLDQNITIFVFPLAKCNSRQYAIVSSKGSSPVFLSYNAILAEIHFERFIIEHEILHKFGLPDRKCSEGINCKYPDDHLSVMAELPQKFYLSRGDYTVFAVDNLNEMDLQDVANRSGSSKSPRPYIEEDGSCPRSIKSTREWRLIYG